MTATFREADHPRATDGKFSPRARPEAQLTLHAEAPVHDPITAAKTALSQAVTGTDTARVQALAQRDGSTRVLVANREVLTVADVNDLAPWLSDHTAAAARARGHQLSYRAEDPITGNELDTALTPPLRRGDRHRRRRRRAPRHRRRLPGDPG